MDVLPEPATTPPSVPASPPKTSGAPAPKPRRPHRRPITHCLNCDAAVAERFCPHCGQETHDQSVALGTLASELASEIASFDSKLVRTVLPLLFHPGFLTNEFNRGRRVRYLSPLKMYLVISALFFVVLAQQNVIKNAHLIRVDPSGAAAAVQNSALAEASQDIDKSLQQAKSPAERARLRAAQAKIRAALPFPSQSTPSKQPPKGLRVNIGSNDIDTDSLPATAALYNTRQAGLPPPAATVMSNNF